MKTCRNFILLFLALLMLFMCGAAMESYTEGKPEIDFNPESGSFYFYRKYIKASKHEDTFIKDFKWEKDTFADGTIFYKHNEKNKFNLYLIPDDITGEMNTVAVSVKYNSNSKNLSQDPNVAKYFKPALFRIVNVIHDTSTSEFNDALSIIKLEAMPKNSEFGMANAGKVLIQVSVDTTRKEVTAFCFYFNINQ